MNITDYFNQKLSKVYRFLFLGALILTLGAGNFSPARAQQSSAALVEISVNNPAIGQNEDVIVHVTISNPNSVEIRVLNWFTPLAESKEPMFSVTRDGNPLAYLGAIYKRAEPTSADYVTLPAGESLSGDVNISALYDFSVAGNYQVAYNASSEKMFTTDNGRRLLPYAGTLTSNTLDLLIDGRSLPVASEVAAQTVIGTNTFTSCSASQQTNLIAARNAASDYATEAVKYFNNNQQGARYTTWFGAYNATRYATVAGHYSKLHTAIDTATPMNFNCGCTDPGIYAYVYPDLPYQIHLCGAFWSSPVTGTDSRAGTLIHEISHFTVVAGTDDYVYGQAGSKNLAINNPAHAIMNADSHEYFAENNPSLESIQSNNYVKDPGFEAYTPSSVWTESSTNFGTPLCTAAACTGAGSPHTGLAWGWLGGNVLDETSILSQTVTFPSGGANLSFYLYIGSADAGSDANDVFTVDIDGTTIFSANATQISSYATYKLVNLNVSSFANGGSHLLTFKSVTTGQIVDFNMDDVLLVGTTTKNITSNGAQDGWTLETARNSGKGGTMDNTSATFNVGDNAANKQYRSILSFNTGAAIPYDAVIISATLKVKQNGIVGGGNPITKFLGFMVDIKKGLFGTAPLAIGDFQAKASKTTGPFSPAISSGWYTISLTPVQSYINTGTAGAGLTQIRLRFKVANNNNKAANFIKFYSGNTTTASFRPTLTVQYYVP